MQQKKASTDVTLVTKWHLSELNRAWKHSAGCNNYARWPKSFYLVPGKYGPVRRPGCWDSAAASLTLSSAVRLGSSNTTKHYTQNQRRRLRNTFIDHIKNHWHPQETIRHRGYTVGVLFLSFHRLIHILTGVTAGLRLKNHTAWRGTYPDFK